MLSADFSTETCRQKVLEFYIWSLEKKKKIYPIIILSRSRERISQTSKTCKEFSNTKPILEEILKCLLHIQKQQGPLVKKNSQ